MFLMWKDEGLLEFFFLKNPTDFLCLIWFEGLVAATWLQSAGSCMDFFSLTACGFSQLTACRSEEELLVQLASGAGQSGRVEREKLIQDNLTCLCMASTFSFYAASMPRRTFQSQTMSDCIGLILTSFLWTSFSSWEHESPKTRRRNLHGRQSWKVQSL